MSVAAADAFADLIEPRVEEDGAPADSLMGVFGREGEPGEPVEFVVPGKPVPWAASRPGKGHGSRFVPAKQTDHADKIRLEFKRLGLAPVPEEFGVVISASFFVQRPKSKHYGSGKNERTIKPQWLHAEPTGRPDLSNLLKLIEDGLTGYAWIDDDQVVRWLDAHKRYVEWWEPEHTVIRLWLSRPMSADDEPAEGQLDLG